MNDLLRRGYTLFLSYSKEKEQPTGVYLKDTNRGVHPIEIGEKEKDFIQLHSTLLQKLKEGETLQMYTSLRPNLIRLQVQAQLGTKKKEGPSYKEPEFFEIEEEAIGENFQDALLQLEKECRKIKPSKQKRKVFRNGGVRYE